MAKTRITFTDDFVLRDEKVGIGTTNPFATLTVIGDTNISGVVTANTFVGKISGDVSLNDIGLISTGTSGITTNGTNQSIDSYPSSLFLSSRYNISVACSGQLTGSYETPSSASISNITAGQFYIPGTYLNIPFTTISGVGTEGRANIIVNGSIRTVGFTSAYNTLVTTSAHGLVGANQPVSFASSIIRAEYVTLVESDVLYTPVSHGIGTSESIVFGEAILDDTYTANALDAGTTYYATSTGSTSFTVQASIGGAQITGIGNTVFASPGNRGSLVGFAVTAGTVYYATSIGTTAFTLARQSSGIGTVVGIAISTGLSIGATISGGVSAVEVVYPGSKYVVNDVVGVNTNLVNSPVGTGFTCRISGVNTNRQNNDFMIMASSTGVDFVEYSSFASNTYLGAFDATTSGGNTILRFSPFFIGMNIKFTRNSIEN
jgi:hypothetical protein